jgi:hypothetical protein
VFFAGMARHADRSGPSVADLMISD